MIDNQHNKDYVRWLKDHLARRSMDDLAMWYAQKPSPTVMKYQAYDINGYTFYTEERDKKSSYQNSSILVECLNSDEVHKDVYYGTIDEIWELDYVKVKVALFKCRWVPLSQVKVDDYGKTYVNLTKMAYHKDPFILARNATQIFYVEDPLHKN